MAGATLLRLLALAVQADMARATLYLSLAASSEPPRKKGRRGGYLPTPRFWDGEFDGGKLVRWRLRYWEGPGWKLLQDPATRDPESRQGREFRAVTRVSRARFDYLLGRLQCDDRFADTPSDGKGRPPKVPLALKLLLPL